MKDLAFHARNAKSPQSRKEVFRKFRHYLSLAADDTDWIDLLESRLCFQSLIEHEATGPD